MVPVDVLVDVLLGWLDPHPTRRTVNTAETRTAALFTRPFVPGRLTDKPTSLPPRRPVHRKSVMRLSTRASSDRSKRSGWLGSPPSSVRVHLFPRCLRRWLPPAAAAARPRRARRRDGPTPPACLIVPRR